MYNGRKFNNKLQRQWAFIKHTEKWWRLHVNAGPECVTAECDWVFSPQAVHYYWLPPPLTWRVDIHLLKVLMEGWGTPILRPEQKDGLSLHVMVAHVWQTWPTFPPFFLTTACHCFKMLFSKTNKKEMHAGTAWLMCLTEILFISCFLSIALNEKYVIKIILNQSFIF